MKSATQNVILEADYPAHSDRAKRSLQQPESAQRHERADQQQGSAGTLSDESQRGLQEKLLAQQHSRRKRQKDAQRSANSAQHRLARAHGNGRDDEQGLVAELQDEHGEDTVAKHTAYTARDNNRLHQP